MLKEFKQFLLRGNVIDLAVGVVIGTAFGNVVGALVADLLTPLIGVFGKIPDFAGWDLPSMVACSSLDTSSTY
jgi:large conductance mechanosensitive channel